MKKLLLITLISLIGIYGCDKNDFLDSTPIGNIVNIDAKTPPEEACGTYSEFTIWAGQHIDAGKMLVYNDPNNLYITFNTAGEWIIEKIHLQIASDLGGIPRNKPGIPIPGQFAYSTDLYPAVASYTYTFPIESINYESFIIAAHLEVGQLGSNGNITNRETAWGGDIAGPGPRWWFYSVNTIQECGGCQIQPGEFRTFTQEQYGLNASEHLAAAYRDALFRLAFPKGLTIGEGSNSGIGQIEIERFYSLRLTSAYAVKNFLPQSGDPAVLNANYFNPTHNINEFLGNVVALYLTIMFDKTDNEFSLSEYYIADLIFAEGPFVDLTVIQLLNEAQRVIGGGRIKQFSIQELNDAVKAVNKNFVNGEIVANPNLFYCPGE